MDEEARWASRDDSPIGFFIDYSIAVCGLFEIYMMTVYITMPRLTNCSNKNCLASSMFSCMENSFCKAMSKLYASYAFFPLSAFSTSFHSVSRSEKEGGAWGGSRISGTDHAALLV